MDFRWVQPQPADTVQAVAWSPVAERFAGASWDGMVSEGENERGRKRREEEEKKEEKERKKKEEGRRKERAVETR